MLEEDVLVTAGLYRILIGSGTITPGPGPVSESTFSGLFQHHADVWMGIMVDGGTELSPRARITTVPYAFAVDTQWIKDLDLDGDGHYKPGSSKSPNDDCHDTDPTVYHDAPELCDEKDNQCPGDAGYGTLDEGCTVSDGMVRLSSGCNMMGYPPGSTYHLVCISSLQVDINEVTNSEYKACVDASACTAPSPTTSRTRGSYYGNPTYDNYPVIYVTWNQANAYCSWAGKRLPTEAEWEYAGRGGVEGKRYAWGGDTITCADANWGRYDSPDPCWDYNGLANDTHEVGSYAPNGYGLYDMTGNVWEFTNDWYDGAYYQYCINNNIVADPPGPASGTDKVVRGGNWWESNLEALALYTRFWTLPTSKFYFAGFRCVKD